MQGIWSTKSQVTTPRKRFNRLTVVLYKPKILGIAYSLDDVLLIVLLWCKRRVLTWHNSFCELDCSRQSKPAPANRGMCSEPVSLQSLHWGIKHFSSVGYISSPRKNWYYLPLWWKAKGMMYIVHCLHILNAQMLANNLRQGETEQWTSLFKNRYQFLLWDLVKTTINLGIS